MFLDTKEKEERGKAVRISQKMSDASWARKKKEMDRS